jgi:hypothetical protein
VIKNRLFPRPWIVLALLLVAAFLTSCIPPVIDSSGKARVTDKIAPTITLTSPQDGSPYSSAIQVMGLAKDLADSSGTPGHVATLTYEVLASNTKGSAGVAADGTFDFTFLAGSLHGPITLRITATDWNGNSIQSSLSLVDSGNGIPGFSAVATSGTVTLTWPGIPLVDHYELFYETSDTLPSEQFSKKVTPATTGVSLTALTNGRVHAFMLKSVPAAGSGAAVNWSTVQKVIPLSQAQLVPRVQPSSGSITISWTPISASASYQVWKGTSPNTAGFVNISGSIQGSSFVDEAVQAGQTYYYAVKPAQYSQLLSWPTPATPSPFPLNSRREIANTTTTGMLSSMTLSADGRYLYVVDAQDGIVIYDVSTPSNPVRRGALANITQPAYVDDLALRLTQTSITVPFTRCALSSSGYLIAVSGMDNGNNVMYGRVSAIDVSDPTNPHEVAGVNLASSITADFGATGMAVRSNRVFVEEFSWNTSSRLQTMDFNPAIKTLTSSSTATLSLSGSAQPQVELSTDGAYAYSVNYSGIEVLSVNTTTGALTYRTAFTTGGGDGNNCARFFSIGAMLYLYVGNFTGFRILNVTTPTAPSIVSTWTLPSAVADIQVSAGRAYLSTTGSGLLVYDVSSPLAPAASGSYQVIPSAVASAPSGNTLFLALGYPLRGFKTLDMTIPRPALKQAAAGSNYLLYQAATDKYIYAANGGALDIYDISAGSWPQLVSTFVAPQGGTGATAVSGNILVTGQAAVSIYDISSPLSPGLLASVPIPNYFVDVRFYGSLVYVACSGFGLKIIDISTPSAPKELGSLAIAGGCTSLASTGSFVLLTHQGGNIAIVDVSDPLAPRQVNDVTLMYYGPGGSSNSGYDIEIAGNYAYVAEGTGGLIVLDITNPTSPLDKGHVAPTTTLQDYAYVAVQGEYAYVSRTNHTLSLIDVSHPAAPALVSSLGPVEGNPEYLKQLVVTGNRVYGISYGPGAYSGLIGYVTQ